jgi:hypothetical protein
MNDYDNDYVWLWYDIRDRQDYEIEQVINDEPMMILGVPNRPV